MSNFQANIISQKLDKLFDKIVSGDYRYEETNQQLITLQEQARQLGHDRTQVDAIAVRAVLHMVDGRLQESLTLNQEGLDYSTRIDYPRGIFRGYNNLGAVQARLGNVEQSLGLCKQALEVCERYDELANRIVLTAVNIAEAARSLGRNDEATAFLQRTLTAYEHLDLQTKRDPIVTQHIGSVYAGLASLQILEGQYEDARLNASLAREINAVLPLVDRHFTSEVVYLRAVYFAPKSETEVEGLLDNISRLIQTIADKGTSSGEVLPQLLTEAEEWLSLKQPALAHFFIEKTESLLKYNNETAINERLQTLKIQVEALPAS
jgi:tetratricopeptide (TPR) repeat protein